MHIYNKDDKLYPSVTTIVGYFKPLDSFEGLMKWSNFLGFKHKDYIKERDNKAAFGTAVHDTVSHLLTGTPVDTKVSDNLTLQYLADYADAIKYFQRFTSLNMIYPDHTVYSEKTFVSEKLGYAGTIDWLGKYKNKLYLFDFKTSSSMHESMKLQLSAYRKLLKEEADIDIDGAAIVFISKSSTSITEVELSELDKMYRKFEIMFDLFKLYQEDIDIKQEDLIQFQA